MKLIYSIFVGMLFLTSTSFAAGTPADPSAPGDITLSCTVSESGPNIQVSTSTTITGVWQGSPYAMLVTATYDSKSFPGETISASLVYGQGARNIMITSTKDGTTSLINGQKQAMLYSSDGEENLLVVNCKSNN